VLPGVRAIENDDDVLAFLPPDHPDVQSFRAVADRFGMMEVALLGLTRSGESVLEPEATSELRDVARKIQEAPGVRLVLSFADLPNPVVTEEGLIVAPLVPPDLPGDEIAPRVLGSRDAVGNLVSEDGRAAALLVFLLPRGEGAAAYAERRDQLEHVREIVHEDWSGEVVFGGAPWIEMAASESSRHDIARLSPIVIAVLAVASALLLRSVSAAAINLVITGLGVGLIMGAHGRFGEPLTIVSSSTPVMMVALGGAFGVHMLAGYQRRSGSSPERASATLRELWLPVTMSGLTTAVAFFALVVMPQVPMQRFGVVAGLAMLLLLGLALAVLPCLLAVLPEGLVRHRPDVGFRLPVRPPAWMLGLVAVVACVPALWLRADPDTSRVFDRNSEVARANAFFDEHFGGSEYMQVTIDANLAEAEVLRRIRDIHETLAALEGVADVRSVVEPLVVVNAGIGGRRGLPENSARAGRALTFLIGHPAMAQLMSEDAKGAVVHVKLAPASGETKVEVAERVRQVVSERTPSAGLREVSGADEVVAAVKRVDVAARLTRLSGKTIEPAQLEGVAQDADPALLSKIAALRDEVLDAEEGAVTIAIPRAEIEALLPAELLEPRGAALEELMRTRLPTLAREDPEGVRFAAEHLGAWIDEARGNSAVTARCQALALGDCERLGPALSELADERWTVADDVTLPASVEVRMIPFAVHVTGQPLIGNAFAQSVTTSLIASTLVSLVALLLVLLVGRFAYAIVPAVWTMAITAGVVALLGHPISVGTSMVSCIAMGAGVDFAIHLGFQARARGGPDAGRRAADEMGGVMLVSAVQLGLAFLVLGLSELVPLQHFGIGLTIGLVVAALGAIWFTPSLVRGSVSKTGTGATLGTGTAEPSASGEERA
jgi:predicted RND superfamily exporter protein